MRVRSTAFVAAAILAFTRVVRADTIVVQIAGFESWNAAIDAWIRRPDSEGATLSVSVGRNGAPLACDRYRLSLQPSDNDAMAIGPCDPTTGETPIRLVHRSSLFDHSGSMPVPRTFALGVEVLVESQPGAELLTGSEAACSVSVQPYAYDYEHGRRSPLDPLHYELVPLRADVHADAESDGWRLTSSANMTRLVVEYEVRDRANGTVVLNDVATLGCDVRSADRPFDMTARILAQGSEADRDRRIRHDIDDGNASFVAGAILGSIGWLVIGGGAAIGDLGWLITGSVLGEGSGVIATMVGLNLRIRAIRERRRTPVVSFAPTNGGASVGMVWRF